MLKREMELVKTFIGPGIAIQMRQHRSSQIMEQTHGTMKLKITTSEVDLELVSLVISLRWCGQILLGSDVVMQGKCLQTLATDLAALLFVDISAMATSQVGTHRTSSVQEVDHMN